MSIRFDSEARIFVLETAHTSYHMKVDALGHLLHLYYGKTIGTGDLMQLYPRTDRGFSPDYYAYRTHRGVSPDLLPQEYTGCNVGDFRLSCLTVADSRGTFGYELDLGKLKRAECTAVKNQIKRFKRLNDLIRTGDYYRLTDPAENAYFTAWQFAAEDGSEALLNLVVTHPQANPLPIHLCFRGLEEDAVYELDGIDYFGSQYAHDVEDGIHKGMRFSGSTLLYAGLVLPQLFGDYPSVQLHLTRKG